MQNSKPTNRRIKRSQYCLYCYTPLPSKAGPSLRCESCGRIHVRIDSAKFWTREPRLLSLERSVKAGIILSVVALFLVLARAVDMGPHRVNTFFIMPLLMLGGVLWWTAGLVTRKARYFSPRMLWSTVLVLMVVGPPVLIFALDISARRESFGPEYWKALLVLASPAAPMFIIATALHLFGDRFEAFKRKRIDGHTASDTCSPPPPPAPPAEERWGKGV